MDKICLASGFFQYPIKLSTDVLRETTALMWEPPNLFPESHQTEHYVAIDTFPVLKQAYQVDTNPH